MIVNKITLKEDHLLIYFKLRNAYKNSKVKYKDGSFYFNKSLLPEKDNTFLSEIKKAINVFVLNENKKLNTIKSSLKIKL